MKRIVLVSLISLMCGLISCKSDDDGMGSGSNQSINSWIYGNMDYVYFWTNEMPSNPNANLNPEDFYESLLYSGDRFSFIYDDYDELIGLLNGVTLESGFEFDLFYESSAGTNVIMQILYIKEGSPADLKGLKRGDIVYQVNGTQFTDTNYRTLLEQMNSVYTATFRRHNENTDAFDTQPEVTISPIEFAENPIFMDSVYEIGGKKIGYLVYTFFSPGPSGSYDDQVDQAFAEFKAEGIEEFILDLRFNGGGSETSFINLASLMVDGATSGDLMYRKQYNTQVQKDIIADPDLGTSFLQGKFSNKTENIGGLLANDKVYVLTTGRTASASEVVINSLKPFMDVFIIGETTVGKDVGSITISNEKDRANNWALQPIVVKLVNSAGEDYPDGFTPDVAIDDQFRVLTPLGDINEPLLNAALAQIGVIGVARIDVLPSFDQKSIHGSFDSKVWNQRILMETNSLHILE